MLNFPNTPAVGDTITLDGIVWVWDGVKWSHPAGTGDGGGAGGGPGISMGEFPPASPRPGDLWFDPVEGQLYIYFQDANSSQWVVTINQGGGGGGGLDETAVNDLIATALASFTPSPTTGTGNTLVLQQSPTINQPVIMGVTNGLVAAIGQVGQTFTDRDRASMLSNNTDKVAQTQSLPAGAWQTWGTFFISNPMSTANGSALGNITSLAIRLTTATTIPAADPSMYPSYELAFEDGLTAQTKFLTVGPLVSNLTATTAVNLVARATWTTTANDAYSCKNSMFSMRVR